MTTKIELTLLIETNLLNGNVEKSPLSKVDELFVANHHVIGIAVINESDICEICPTKREKKMKNSKYQRVFSYSIKQTKESRKESVEQFLWKLKRTCRVEYRVHWF